MKKLLTSLAILVIAATTQAATMTWQISGIKQPTDSSASGTAGWLAYLFSTEDTSVSAVTSALEKGDLTILSSSFVDPIGTTGGTAKQTGVGSFSAGETFEGFAIVLDAANADDAKNFLTTSTGSATVNAAGANITVRLAASSWTAMSSSDQPVNPDDPTPPIPEPATGALALAGVALLFRRRR